LFEIKDEETAEKYLLDKGILKKFSSCPKCNYPKTHKIFKIIRQRIYQHCSQDDVLKGEVEVDESYFGGRRRKGKRGSGTDKILVFGILERGGKVKVEIVKDVSVETLLKEIIK